MTSTTSSAHNVAFQLPRSVVGRVIGKQGETVRALQAFCQCTIQINQSVDPAQCNIFGPSQGVELAVSMIRDMVQGTFKGFALLRQSMKPMPGPDGQLYVEPRPMYAPGYGLIPASQVNAIQAADLSGLPKQGSVASTTMVQQPSAAGVYPAVVAPPVYMMMSGGYQNICHPSMQQGTPQQMVPLHLVDPSAYQAVSMGTPIPSTRASTGSFHATSGQASRQTTGWQLPHNQ